MFLLKIPYWAERRPKRTGRRWGTGSSWNRPNYGVRCRQLLLRVTLWRVRGFPKRFYSKRYRFYHPTFSFHPTETKLCLRWSLQPVNELPRFFTHNELVQGSGCWLPACRGNSTCALIAGLPACSSWRGCDACMNWRSSGNGSVWGEPVRRGSWGRRRRSNSGVRWLFPCNKCISI